MSIVNLPYCTKCGVPHVPSEVAERVRRGENVQVRIVYPSGVSGNVLRWGTGAINVDACRVASDGDVKPRGSSKLDTDMHEGWARPWMEDRAEVQKRHDDAIDRANTIGRWPANVIHDGSAEVVAAFPESDTARIEKPSIATGSDGWGSVQTNRGTRGYDGEGSAARFFYEAKPDEPKGRWPANVITDGSTEVVAAFPDVHGAGSAQGPQEKWSDGKNNIYGEGIGAGPSGARIGDSGSAARFFYSSKADGDDRLGSKHPTVKPLDLMQYLVRLVTPKGGTVLDPFAGTGTTGEAAWREGMRADLIERDTEYQNDIRRRMKFASTAGPGERKWESAKARNAGKPRDDGPLFR